MVKIRFANGAWTSGAGFILAGAGGFAGATAENTNAQTIGWLGMILGLLILVWGITLDGEHWWQLNNGRKSRRISLADALRRMGHGSQWSLDAELVSPRDWAIYANRELLDALSRGELDAWGLWRPTYGTPNLAVTKINASEWSTLSPELRLNISRRISMANRITSEKKLAGIYTDISLDRNKVEKIWPRWSILSRIKRKLNHDSNMSFAEKFGQIEIWRNGNNYLTKKSEYFWNEPR